MSQSQSAKRFARAFVDGAMKEADPMASVSELKGLSMAIESRRDLRNFFRSPLFAPAEKIGIIEGFGKMSGISAGVDKILRMLLDQSRFHLLPEVVTYAERMMDERLGTAKATVTTAIPIPAADLARLGEVVARLVGRKAELSPVVDPSILGGVRVTVGSVVYDGSLKGQLDNLKEELMKG